MKKLIFWVVFFIVLIVLLKVFGINGIDTEP
jgi:hypothetical protein